MNDLIRPGTGLLFMKVGIHAQEALEEIIARKTKEIESAGFALWGYGGNTCHPETMVQPFVRSYEKRGKTVYLCMHEMKSNHWAHPIRADQMSVDGIKWEDIPPAINALGSRYALVIKDLHREEFDLPLAGTRVAIGNSLGRPGDKYIAGRVDKACLEFPDEVSPEAFMDGPKTKIGIVARVAEPYAVYLRNR